MMITFRQEEKQKFFFEKQRATLDTMSNTVQLKHIKGSAGECQVSAVNSHAMLAYTQQGMGGTKKVLVREAVWWELCFRNVSLGGKGEDQSWESVGRNVKKEDLASFQGKTDECSPQGDRNVCAREEVKHENFEPDERRITLF